MALNSYYHKEISKFIKYYSHQNYAVAEIGCKEYSILEDLDGLNKTGICFDANAYEDIKSKNPTIQFILENPENIVTDKKFDLIIISNKIGEFADVQQVLTQLNKLCNSNTKIIVCYYNFFWEPIIKLSESLGIKRKTKSQNWITGSDLSNLLYLSNFSVYNQSRRVLVPIYIPLISWFFNKFLAHLPIINLLALNTFTFAKYTGAVKEDITKKYSTTVVIPARNESGNIENAILRMPNFGKHTEIIFVEGNSTDNTWQTIQDIAIKYKNTHQIKIAQQQGKGKADAVRVGYELASNDILMILDADLTVPPEDLPKFYNAIASGQGDFINGSRLVYPMEKEAMRSLNLLGNKFFSWAFTWLLEQKFKDTLCGTKVLFKKDYENLKINKKYFGDFDPFGDFDLIFGAHKLNLKIVEVPIRYRDRTYGSTNISRFKHGIILLRMCLFASKKIKFR